MDTTRSLIGDGVVPWKTDAKTHSTIWFFSKTLTEVEATKFGSHRWNLIRIRYFSFKKVLHICTQQKKIGRQNWWKCLYRLFLMRSTPYFFNYTKIWQMIFTWFTCFYVKLLYIETVWRTTFIKWPFHILLDKRIM